MKSKKTSPKEKIIERRGTQAGRGRRRESKQRQQQAGSSASRAAAWPVKCRVGRHRCRRPNSVRTDARMHQITTVHGEIWDKERWGMDGPESIASRSGGGRSGEVDGGVAANQGFDVSSSFPLRFVLWSCSARRIMVQYAMTVSSVVVPVRRIVKRWESRTNGTSYVDLVVPTCRAAKHLIKKEDASLQCP
uniref:Uncharacterized protein n=1 Tax=Oryza glumipatula TaxID=40148 RepID=A0A0D9Z1C2_9ORYZ